MYSELLKSFDLHFSYGQFYVFNVQDVPKRQRIRTHEDCFLPQHISQGFFREKMQICFFTFVTWGNAKITVYKGSYDKDSDSNDKRVIGVPFEVLNGKVDFGSPEGSSSNSSLELNIGHYWLTVAQKLIKDEESQRSEIDVRFYFEPVSSPRTISFTNRASARHLMIII
jgi:hypothetical protein